MRHDLEHLIAVADAQHRAYKRATRRLQHRRRLERTKEPDHTPWLTAVKRDDQDEPAERELVIEEQVTA